MKIKYRLATGFLFIMLLFGAIASYILAVSTSHIMAYIDLSEGFRKDVSAAVEVSSYAKRAEGHLNLYWIYGNDIDREKFHQRVASLDEHIAKLHKVITSPEGKVKIEQLKTESKKIHAYGYRVIKSYQRDPEGFTPQKYEDLIRGVHDASSAVRSLGIEITELESSVMTERIAATKRNISSLQFFMVIAILSAIVISIFFSLFFAHSVSKPIENIRDTALDISKGNLDREAVTTLGGEIGDLARVFNSMVKELKRSQAEALRAGHLASIGELAAGVAHEINNPINGVINYAQLLADASPPGSKEQDRANRIVAEGNRVAEIVRGLLSYARETKDERVPVSINELLTKAFVLTTQQSKKDKIKIQTHVDENIPEILVHPQQIQQVILNLLSNANYALNLKYAGDHEKKLIDIRVEEEMVGGMPFVKMCFLDYGTGISAGNLQKAINPFYTTKPEGEGTGLGLSVSDNIIRNHNGSLKIESKEGEFTRVTIYLPVADTDEQ